MAFVLTHNFNFPILIPSKSDFLSILYLSHQKATSYQFYTYPIKKRVLINKYTLQKEIVKSRYEMERITNEINELLKQKIAEAPKSIEIASLDQRFKNIDDKITAVKEQTVGLRQAINPSKPEEILTIARLTDDVKAIRKDLEDLESGLNVQQKNFQDSILRELKSSGDSTTLILVVLIPLVLNFLYTVWKDFKSDKNEKSKS